MKITDIHNPWRDGLQPARFRSAYFFVDTDSVDSGRRVVVHEFPKKNVPYSEDMGRRAYEFTVRGYCISYPRDPVGPSGDDLRFMRDYRLARDRLVDELASGEPGMLYMPVYLPTYGGREIMVICPRYRLSEEQKAGGYCVFDMTFVELGVAPREPQEDARETLLRRFEELMERVIDTTKSTPRQTAPTTTTTTNV